MSLCAQLGYEPPICIDLKSLSRLDYAFDPELGTTFLGGEKRDKRFLRVDRGWIRRVAPAGWEQGLRLGTRDAATAASWLTLLSAMARREGTWLSSPDALTAADNKLLQYTVAARLGVSYPRTLVTSSREELRQYFDGDLVLKPIGPAYFSDGGRATVLYASRTNSSNPVLDLLPGAPFIAQELLDVAYHLRVATVDDSAWVAGLDARGQPFDWRRNATAHSGFCSTVDQEASQAALALAHEMHIGYSSQDWVRTTEGKLAFLDLNPGGQWLFLPYADEVTRKIASWLMGQHR